jgi:hypothetical protein
MPSPATGCAATFPERSLGKRPHCYFSKPSFSERILPSNSNTVLVGARSCRALRKWAQSLDRLGALRHLSRSGVKNEVEESGGGGGG